MTPMNIDQLGVQPEYYMRSYPQALPGKSPLDKNDPNAVARLSVTNKNAIQQFLTSPEDNVLN